MLRSKLHCQKVDSLPITSWRVAWVLNIQIPRETLFTGLLKDPREGGFSEEGGVLESIPRI